jgi:hypothetical protein
LSTATIEIDARPRGRRRRRSVQVVVPRFFTPFTRALFVHLVRWPLRRQDCVHLTVPVTRLTPDDGAGSVTRREIVQRRCLQRADTLETRGEAPSVVLP